MILPRTSVLITLALCALSPLAFQRCEAQDDWRWPYGIDVGWLQRKELSGIEDRFDDRIRQLEETVQTSQMQMRQLLFQRDTEREAVLRPEQLDALNTRQREETLEVARTNIKFAAEFGDFLKAFVDAEDVTLFEGLPRLDEAELAKIREKSGTIEIGKWSFYAEPLAASGSVIEKLRATLVDRNSLEPYSGGKFCGGFHPDFCVQWTTGDETMSLLVCLGCHEAEFISPEGETIFDFSDAAWKSFVQIAIATFRHHGDIMRKMDEMIGQ
jgi:hypothetical protein